jgi:hypothetical protein
MDCRTSRVQFSTESVAVTVLQMVSLSVRVCSGSHLLKICFCQRRFVRGQRRVMCGAARGKKNNGDEGRQQDQGKVSTLSVGQGVSPARVINSYSQSGKKNLWLAKECNWATDRNLSQSGLSLCPTWTLCE